MGRLGTTDAEPGGSNNATGDETGAGAGAGVGAGAGAAARTGSENGSESNENQGSSWDNDASGRDGNWLAEKAHMANLSRKQADNRPASGHTHRRKARAQNYLLWIAMLVRLVARVSCKRGLSTPRARALACAWGLARRM